MFKGSFPPHTQTLFLTLVHIWHAYGCKRERVGSNRRQTGNRDQSRCFRCVMLWMFLRVVVFGERCRCERARRAARRCLNKDVDVVFHAMTARVSALADATGCPVASDERLAFHELRRRHYFRRDGRQNCAAGWDELRSPRLQLHGGPHGACLSGYDLERRGNRIWRVRDICHYCDAVEAVQDLLRY